MIFIYLLIGGIIGMITMIVIEYTRTGKDILHIIKGSCSIDSVRFEKALKKIEKYIYRIGFFLKLSISRFLQRLKSHSKNQIHKLKKTLRKKLQPEVQKVSTSAFISKIKAE